jgi:hypothetical protein
VALLIFVVVVVKAHKLPSKPCFSTV